MQNMWKRKKFVYKSKQIYLTMKHGDDRIMVWEWFCFAGTGKVVTVGKTKDGAE